MENKKVITFLAFGLLCRLFLGFPMASAALPGPATFVLERSTNRNQLLVDVDLARVEPVRPTWRMLEEDGHVEELTSFERSHFYGVDITARTASELTFHFRALPSLPLHVRAGRGTYLVIFGTERRLRKIYLRMAGGLFPALAAADFEVGESGEPSHSFRLSVADGTWKDSPANP